MDRETKTIHIGAEKFLVKTYATAREANAIQQAYFKGAKLEMVGDQPKISDFNPGVQFDVHKEMIAQMVVSLNGDDQNIVARCEDLPNDIFGELVAELDGLVAKKKS